ncbi:MAG: hypothetical protein J1F03_03625 [Oscillospiraceae bacterium]|nr:hypothetical protein [Oscillospiraceae bacterium]
MKIKSRFVVALIIFAAVLAVLCGAFLIYVGITASDYDRVQPERIVEEQIEMLKNGELVSKIDFEKLCSNRFENNDPAVFKENYSSKVVGKELSYKIVTSESSEFSKTYVLLSGEENVGKIKLNGKNPKTRLFFFTSAEWSLDDFTPIITDMVYNLRVYCPEGLTMKINGIEPGEDEREELSGTPSYSVMGLLNAPEIKYTDKEGNEIQYTAENNIIKPVLFDYHITLPKGLRVESNGKSIEGIPSGNDEVFLVREMDKPEVIIKDSAGAEYKYTDGEDIPLFGYNVSIPEGCTLSIEGMTVPEPVTEDNPDAEKLLKYAGVTLPKEKSYTFSLFSENIYVDVLYGSDTKRFNVSYGSSRLSPETLDAVPEKIANEINVLEVMELWSKFMTDDLGGGDHGLSEIARYLIPDSEYYTYAKQWASGIDITFTSTHTITGFNNESVANFTSYGDHCFSCSVYFEKGMALTFEDRFVGNRTDIFNSIVYFVKIGDGSWRIAVMHDNLGVD